MKVADQKLDLMNARILQLIEGLIVCTSCQTQLFIKLSAREDVRHAFQKSENTLSLFFVHF
jgi:hypothetical protein